MSTLNISFVPHIQILRGRASPKRASDTGGHEQSYDFNAQNLSSMLTDILIASTGDAPEILSAASGSWPRLQFNSLDNMALAGLWSALGGTGAVDFEGEKYLLAHTEERWVFEFPQDFVQGLSAVQSGAVAEVAMSWVKHDELVHMGADGPGVEPVVEAMSGFARQAIGQGKSLLLFMCL
ncbi:UNVERIFIED_ORG: hypothetical protein ABIC43_006642 [Variovorax guangxiensis]